MRRLTTNRHMCILNQNSFSFVFAFLLRHIVIKQCSMKWELSQQRSPHPVTRYPLHREPASSLMLLRPDAKRIVGPNVSECCHCHECCLCHYHCLHCEYGHLPPVAHSPTQSTLQAIRNQAQPLEHEKQDIVLAESKGMEARTSPHQPGTPDHSPQLTHQCALSRHTLFPHGFTKAESAHPASYTSFMSMLS